MSSRRFVVAAAAAGQRLDVFLSQEIADVSRSQLARQIGQAAVTVNGAAGVPSRKLHAGDVVVWEPPPVVATEIAAEAIALTIVHEDQWLVVVDKPAGLVVHPAPGHEAGTLVNALLAHCHDLRGIGGELRPGIVHRIDKDTSGLLVVAKDDATMNALGAAFKAHTIERVYEALVAGAPPGRERADRHVLRARSARAEEVLQPRALGEARGHQLAPHREVSGRSSNGGAARDRADAPGARSPGGARLSRCWATRSTAGRRAIWRCAPIADALGRQALHARLLGFVHPATGKQMTFTSELPPDMRTALAALEAL